jgi:hypothetical protein
MEVGDTSVAGTMEGSFLAPDMHMSWEAPAAAASGSVDLSRDANSFTCRAPALDVSAALLLKPAPIDALKTVLTQVNALAIPPRLLLWEYSVDLSRNADSFTCRTAGLDFTAALPAQAIGH